MLLAFLANRSAPCPRCRFDLRDAREPRCPECGEPLRLQVGAARPLLGWFILAIAPGIFSAIAGAVLAVPLTLQSMFGRIGDIPPEPWFAEGVAVVSIAVLATLLRRRWWFVALPVRRQRTLAVVIWGLHVAAAGYLIFAL